MCVNTERAKKQQQIPHKQTNKQSPEMKVESINHDVDFRALGRRHNPQA